MHAVKNVLIVGAGMCGMSLGVALKRAGITCEIVESRPTLSEPGTGISLQGPALRALRSVGVLDRCIARGFGYSHFKACDVMGNVTGTVDLPRLLGPAYPATIGILRQSVHEVLACELEKVAVPIRLSTTVKSLTQGDQGVTVEFTNGEPARYHLVLTV
jgi:2-polyprenyl-6-methoxyphenol hydroxylase-like FAD-dependent oxidoreductase